MKYSVKYLSEGLWLIWIDPSCIVYGHRHYFFNTALQVKQANLSSTSNICSVMFKGSDNCFLYYTTFIYVWWNTEQFVIGRTVELFISLPFFIAGISWHPSFFPSFLLILHIRHRDFKAKTSLVMVMSKFQVIAINGTQVTSHYFKMLEG